MEITQRVRVDDPETGESVVLKPGKVPKEYEKLIDNPTVVAGYEPEYEFGDRPSPVISEAQVNESLIEYVDDEGNVLAEAGQQFEIADRPEPEFPQEGVGREVQFDRPDGEVFAASSDTLDEEHPLHGLRLKDDFVTFASLNDIDLGDASSVKDIKAVIEDAIAERTAAAATGGEVVADHPEPEVVEEDDADDDES